MPKKTKIATVAPPARIVLRISRNGKTSKAHAWMPFHVYPNVSIHRTHGWVNLDGWSIEPGRANAFEARFLPDVIWAWQDRYDKAWTFQWRAWVKGVVGNERFSIRVG
jgi:hypothetical protein